MKKIEYDRSAMDWVSKYQVELNTVEQAIAEIRSGWRVFLATGCARPQSLVNELLVREDRLFDVELVQLFDPIDMSHEKRDMSEQFRFNTFMMTRASKEITERGVGRYTPIGLHEISSLFSTGKIPLDAALVQVSPPDQRGMCSLGISVDIVKSACENAGLVIAEINPAMPFTHGESQISIYDLDILVPVENHLLEVLPNSDSEIGRKIAGHLDGLIENGSTLQIGIGVWSELPLDFLYAKSDLGIHTEMLGNAIIDLIERGVVTGDRKSVDRGKVVASFCMGTRELYEYVHENPKIVFRPIESITEPTMLARQNKMVTINSAMEIDLTGQVCRDSVGFNFLSSMGERFPVGREVGRSDRGKSIFVLPSMDLQTGLSRIVTSLDAGSGIVTNRTEVQYVVTEYGSAYLHGKSIQERALALISIAHPDFRAELIQKAIDARYLQPEMEAVKGKLFVEPQGLRTTMAFDDGTHMRFRPIHPTDEPRMKELFYALSEGTIYYRFGKQMKKLPQKQLQDFVYIDHRHEVSIVGIVPQAYGDEIVALGCYYLDAKTNRAELALVVRDTWQNKGIGTFLAKHLAQLARRQGIRGFTAEIHFSNNAMRKVMYKLEGKMHESLNDYIASIVVDL